MYSRTLIVITIVLIPILGFAFSADAAQSKNANIGRDQNRISVSWTIPWTKVEDISGVAPSGDEVLALADDFGGTVLIISFDPNTDVVDQYESFITTQEGSADDYNLIESGSYEEVNYSLSQMTNSGYSIGSFALFRGGSTGGSGLVFTAPLSRFADGLQAAQSAISIDGSAAFDGVDAALLASGLDSQTETAPAPSADNPESSSTAGAGVWTDPQWGYSVTWKGVWQPTDGPSGTSFGLTDSRTTVVGILAFQGNGSPGVLWFDPLNQAFASSLPQGSTSLGSIVGNDKILMAAVTPDGLFIQDIYFLNNNQTIVAVTILVTGQNPETTIEDFRNSVTIAGQRPMDMWEEIYP